MIMRVSIIIPCYNEKETIGEVIRRLSSVMFPCESEIIVVDDGSTDGTGEVVRDWAGCKIAVHEVNRGKGRAIQSGLAEASGDLVVIQDGDMEYPPEELPKLVQPILDGEADVVLGSRFTGEFKGMSLSHHVANRGLSYVTSFLFGRRITDVMTGHKAFRTEVLRGLDLRSSEFEIETEMVAKAIAKGYRVKEVPIRYHYRKKGVAKISWRHGFRSLGVLLKIRLSSGFASETILGLGLLFIVLLAFALRFRWLLLAVQSSMPLAPDAEGYIAGASELLHLSYRSPREPMFSVVAALFLSFLGVSIASFRLSTVCLGTLIVFVTYRIARNTSGASAGLLASSLVATNVLLIWNSIRGLREELFSCVLLMFVFLIIRNEDGLTAKSSMMVGLVAAILCLTKLEGLIVVVGVSAYHVWHSKISHKKTNWRFVAIILMSSIIAIFAWFGFCALVFNNPFETTTVQGTWWYHYEFGGEPKRITAFDYIFRYHTAEQILFLTARGAVRILRMLNELWFLTPIGFGLLCLGCLSLLKSEKNAVLHFALLSGLVSNVFFFGVAAGADSRLLYPYIPIFCLMIASASTATCAFLAKHRVSLIKFGFVLDLKVWEKTRVRLLEPYYLAVLAILLPFAVVVIHLAGYLLSFPRP
jgi:glycosyltransferase involved in cell wall biosynthesis